MDTACHGQDIRKSISLFAINMLAFTSKCLFFSIYIFISACDRSSSNQNEFGDIYGEPETVEKKLDLQKVKQGEKVYQTHCAVCHGAKAVGTKDWRKADAHGKYPPPPLNGTAHAWHHPTEVLKEVILDGSIGDGNMPSWRGKLTEQEVDNVILWMQSLWPAEIYSTWYNLDRQYREDNK